MAKLFGDVVGKLKAKKPRRGSPYHLAGGRGGSIIVKGNPHGHRSEGPQSAWIFDFTCKAQWSKIPDPRAFEESRAFTQDTGWYYRDMIHSAMSGKLFSSPEERVTTPTARVTRDAAAQAVGNGVTVTLTPDREEWDNNFFWNPDLNQTRLTVRSKGVYLVGGNANFNGITGGRRELQLWVNNERHINLDAVSCANTQPVALSGFSIWYFDELDYLELRVFQNVAGVTALLRSLWMVAITPEGVT